MATARTTMENLTWKYPKTNINSVVIGDSQMKHFFTNFDPLRHGTPAFICQLDATVSDILPLLDFVPRTASVLVLHVGANDIRKRHTSATSTFGHYQEMLELVHRERPDIADIFVTLLLPQTPNRRRGCANRRAVERYNREACHFNSLLRAHCRRSRNVRYIDHGMEWLPSGRVFAADGLHPSFEGVAVMTSHLQQVFLRNSARSAHAWMDHASSVSTTHPNLNSNSDFPVFPQREEAKSDLKNDLNNEIVGGARRKFARPPARTSPTADEPGGPSSGRLSYVEAAGAGVLGAQN